MPNGSSSQKLRGLTTSCFKVVKTQWRKGKSHLFYYIHPWTKLAYNQRSGILYLIKKNFGKRVRIFSVLWQNRNRYCKQRLSNQVLVGLNYTLSTRQVTAPTRISTAASNNLTAFARVSPSILLIACKNKRYSCYPWTNSCIRDVLDHVARSTIF